MTGRSSAAAATAAATAMAVAVAVAVAAAVAVATGRSWPRLLWWSPGTGASTPQKTLGNVLGAARSLSGYRLLSSVRS